MELLFSGRGAAFNTEEGNTNAYFVEDGKLFLLDCGEMMFSYLKQHGLLNQAKEIYVVISHMHSDHCGSLGSLGFYCQYTLGIKVKYIVPHNEEYIQDLKTLLKIFGNTEGAYEMLYEEEVDGKFKAFDKIRYDKTEHDFSITCYSFIFETKQGAIFYSADTRIVDNLVRFVENYTTIDKIYMEVTNHKVPGDIHLYLGDLLECINNEIKSKIYMMHLRNPECMDEVIQAGFKVVDITE